MVDISDLRGNTCVRHHFISLMRPASFFLFARICVFSNYIDVAHAIAADSVFQVTSTLQSARIPIKNKAYPTNWVCLKS